MNYKERITAMPSIMLGKPTIKGTRITVELLIKKMSEGMEINDLIKAYPNITREDVFAALAYCAEVMSQEEMLAS